MNLADLAALSAEKLAEYVSSHLVAHPGLCDGTDASRALAELERRANHAGEPPTNERIMQAHTHLSKAWMEQDGPVHRSYHQSTGEACYVCTMWRRLQAAEAEAVCRAEEQDALQDAIANALYALDPNQGERPDSVMAACWLRTTLPTDHPNWFPRAALASSVRAPTGKGA